MRIYPTTQEEIGGVSLSGKLDADYISVAITNTGKGIPDNKKEEIFESFNRFTSGKTALGESTGLGLSIVRELVTSLDGRITLDSGDSKITFTVVLPFIRNVGKINNNLVSYDYTISEIDNMLAESEERD